MLRAAATFVECLYSQSLVVCIEVYFHLNFCSYKSNNDSLLLVSILVHNSLIRFHCVGTFIGLTRAMRLICHVRNTFTSNVLQKVECKNSRFLIRRNVCMWHCMNRPNGQNSNAMPSNEECSFQLTEMPGPLFQLSVKTCFIYVLYLCNGKSQCDVNVLILECKIRILLKRIFYHFFFSIFNR